MSIDISIHIGVHPDDSDDSIPEDTILTGVAGEELLGESGEILIGGS